MRPPPLVGIGGLNVPPAIPVSIAYRFPSLSKDKAFPRVAITPAAAAAGEPAPILIAPRIFPSVLNAMIFGSSTLGSLTSVPSASANGAQASIRKTVPLGNFLVATGLTAMPNGPVSPVMSFSLTIFNVPSGCTASLLI